MVSDQPNVSNIPVRRNNEYVHLVDKLVSDKTERGKPVFSYGKDLMVFAAMVGYDLNVRELVGKENTQIFLHVYASDEKDGYIFMLGLLSEKDEKCLKAENLKSCIRHFEEFCNGGLSVIAEWLHDAGTPDHAAEILYEKIEEQVMGDIADERAPNIDISFE